MRRYEIEDLEYASGWERAYGVADDRRMELEAHQRRLERFAVPPISRFDDARLAAVEKMAEYVIANGFEPTRQDNVFEAARVDFVHSTVKYEGSTMSAEDVALILNEDVVIADKPFSEHLEVIDVERAFALMTSFVSSGRPPSSQTALELHAVAAEHLDDCEAGEWRWDQRYVAGSRVLPPPPGRVGELVESAFSWYAEKPSISRAALFHLLFEDIHPFQDGNGRTGRIILNHMLMSQGLPVIALKTDSANTKAYYGAISRFAADVERRDGTEMVRLVVSALEESLQKQIAKVEQRQAAEEGRLGAAIASARTAQAARETGERPVGKDRETR